MDKFFVRLSSILIIPFCLLESEIFKTENSFYVSMSSCFFVQKNLARKWVKTKRQAMFLCFLEEKFSATQKRTNMWGQKDKKKLSRYFCVFRLTVVGAKTKNQNFFFFEGFGFDSRKVPVVDGQNQISKKGFDFWGFDVLQNPKPRRRFSPWLKPLRTFFNWAISLLQKYREKRKLS